MSALTLFSFWKMEEECSATSEELRDEGMEDGVAKELAIHLQNSLREPFKELFVSLRR